MFEDIDIQRLREENERLRAENDELFHMKESFDGVVQDRNEAIDALRRIVNAWGKPTIEAVMRDIQIAYGKR